MLKTRIDANEKRIDANERITLFLRKRHPDESQDLTDSESSSE